MNTFYGIFLIVALLEPNGNIDVSVVSYENSAECYKVSGIIESDFAIQDAAIAEQQSYDDYEFHIEDERTKLIRVGCKTVPVVKYFRM